MFWLEKEVLVDPDWVDKVSEDEIKEVDEESVRVLVLVVEIETKEEDEENAKVLVVELELD